MCCRGPVLRSNGFYDSVIVPEDCVTAIDPEDHREALRSMARVMKVDVRASTEIDLTRASDVRAA